MQSTTQTYKHYYPFGLKHGSYYSTANIKLAKKEANELVPQNLLDGELKIKPTTDRAYKYKYQGQERQNELNLNWDSFKWRNYDYAIGRFMSIDPLAEKYTYNSTYAFSENKVTSHFELEGLEAVLAITFGKELLYRGKIIKSAQYGAQSTNINTPDQATVDFVKAFKTASNSDSKGIGFVAIWGHGVPGMIFASGHYSDINIGISDLKQLDTAIQNKEISFTDNAVIFIGSCNAGTPFNKEYTSFAKQLSKITGATVIGANDSVGLGYPIINPENSNTMRYIVKYPNSKGFISFKKGESKKLGASIDVIQLMNRTLNPPKSIKSFVSAEEIVPVATKSPNVSTGLVLNTNP